MNYDARAVSEKKNALIKGISELIDVLSEIDIDGEGASDTITLPDGTEVNLGIDEIGGEPAVIITLGKRGLKYTIVKQQDEALWEKEFRASSQQK